MKLIHGSMESLMQYLAWFKEGIYLKFEWPNIPLFRYYNGWWYTISWKLGKYANVAALGRVNAFFTTSEAHYPGEDDKTSANIFAVDPFDTEGGLWILGNDRTKLYAWDGDDDWVMVKDFSEDGDDWITFLDEASAISVRKHRLIIYGKGLAVSNDYGSTWQFKEDFKEWYVTAATQDHCGKYYFAVWPDYEASLGGVFYNNGDSPSSYKLSSGDKLSFIGSLAIDHTHDILYAGTYGESLLRIKLSDCAE